LIDKNVEERSNYEKIKAGTLAQSGMNYSTSFLTAIRAREPLERQRVKEKNRRKRMDDAVRRLQKVMSAERKQRQLSSTSNSSEGTCETSEDIRDAEGERASKAAIVEAAIEYILQLQSEIAEQRARRTWSLGSSDSIHTVERSDEGG
jgi:transposase